MDQRKERESARTQSVCPQGADEMRRATKEEHYAHWRIGGGRNQDGLLDRQPAGRRASARQLSDAHARRHRAADCGFYREIRREGAGHRLLRPAGPEPGLADLRQHHQDPEEGMDPVSADGRAQGRAGRAHGHRHGCERGGAGGIHHGRGQGARQPAVCDGGHGHRRRSGDRRQGGARAGAPGNGAHAPRAAGGRLHARRRMPVSSALPRRAGQRPRD